MEPEEPIFIRVSVAACLIGLSEAKIYQQVRNDLYEARRCDTSTLIRVDSFLRYLNALPLARPLAYGEAPSLILPRFRFINSPPGEPVCSKCECERLRVYVENIQMAARPRRRGRR